MLRYKSTTERPSNPRSEIPLLDFKHFSRVFGPKICKGDKFWRTPGDPRWGADVHDFGLLSQKNWTDEDQKKYHFLRRRSLRLPKDDPLIGYRKRSQKHHKLFDLFKYLQVHKFSF